MKIAFFDTKPHDMEWFDKMNTAYGYEIKYFESKLNRDTASLANGYPVVVVFVNDTLDAETINQLYAFGVRLVALRCAGYNHVDFGAAFEKIHVARVPDYSPHAVAEHAAALLLSLNRKTYKAYTRVRENNFSIGGLMGMDLYGKTAGVIGTGKIGRIFIDICRGFGMRVIAYDPYPAAGTDITYVSLEELYGQSDVISLHCPLTKETRHIINTDAFDRMKKNVLLVNTSRGGLIDSESLAEAIKHQKIAGAALDVYEEESEYFFEDLSNQILQDDLLARLISFPNMLITSHQGFFTREAMEKIASVTLENIRQFETGAFMENEICYACLHKGKESCLHKQGKRCF